MNHSTVLVTGATGFLGRQILRKLHAAKHSTVVLVRQRSAWLSQAWRDEAGEVEIIEGSPLATDRWLTDDALASVSTIIHTAAIVKHSRSGTDEMIELNVEGTLQMVHLAKRLGARMLFVSSSGTVGCYRFADVAADEDAPYAEGIVRRWPYYMSKIHAEREARRLADKLGVELVIVRPPVLLGPDDHRMRSTGYVLKGLQGKVPAIPPGSMHFADVRDVAGALVRIAELEQTRDIYHLPGYHSSLGEFFRMLGEVSGVRVSSLRLPPFAALGMAKIGALMPARPSWLPDPVVLEMSIHHWGLRSLFANEIAYAPRPARQTLADTVAWLRTLPDTSNSELATHASSAAHG